MFSCCDIQELWRLFDFVTKGNLLGPLKDFKEKYDNPIVQVKLVPALGQKMSLYFVVFCLCPSCP